MPSSRKGISGKDRREKEEGGGGGLVSTLLLVGGVVCAWAALEVVFKPLLQAGRAAIRKSLDPDYDVDDELDSNNNQTNPRQGAATPQPDEDPQIVTPKQSAAIDDPPQFPWQTSPHVATALIEYQGAIDTWRKCDL